MFDFGNANEGQRKAISTVEGSVLITAGPGTGKTFTLVQRAIYLIEECNEKPESIFIATFTEKAAKELNFPRLPCGRNLYKRRPQIPRMSGPCQHPHIPLSGVKRCVWAHPA